MRGNIQAEGLLISNIRSLDSGLKRHDEKVRWEGIQRRRRRRGREEKSRVFDGIDSY